VVVSIPLEYNVCAADNMRAFFHHPSIFSDLHCLIDSCMQCPIKQSDLRTCAPSIVSVHKTLECHRKGSGSTAVAATQAVRALDSVLARARRRLMMMMLLLL